MEEECVGCKQSRPICRVAHLLGRESLKNLKGEWKRGSILHNTKTTLHVAWRMGYWERSWRLEAQMREKLEKRSPDGRQLQMQRAHKIMN